MSISAHLTRVRTQIADAALAAGRDPASVSLLAVSKTFGPEAVIEAALARAVLALKQKGSTVVLVTQPGQSGWGHVGAIAALLAAILLATWLLFLGAEPVQRVLGRSGSNLVSRILGMLLAALAAQTVLGGLAEFFKIPVGGT